jgi:hypothetical protein
MGEQTMKKYCPLCGEEMESEPLLDPDVDPEFDEDGAIVNGGRYYYCVNSECQAFEG